jgi:hypothetical protein
MTGGIWSAYMETLIKKKGWRTMTLQQVKDFLDGKKTGSGLSIAVFTPAITSILTKYGVAGDDAANIVNTVSLIVGGIITVWGIIDRHIRSRDKNPQREVK